MRETPEGLSGEGKAQVSVIVPAYDAASFLPACLDSILSQTYPNFEVIVVDDGSRDATPEIAERYARQDQRVRLIRQDNQGVGAARNRGIAEATGKYIAPIDADDVWLSEKLAKQVERMEESDEVGFVYCWSRSMDAQGTTYGGKPHSLSGRVFQPLIFKNFIGNASVPLYRASILRAVGGYSTRAEQGGTQGCEDWLLSLLVAAASPVEVVPEYLVGYRRHGGSMSRDFEGMAASYEFAIRRIIELKLDVPRPVARWSAGHFYLWILKECYRSDRRSQSLRWVAMAIRRDPTVLLAPLVYRAFFGTLSHLIAKHPVRNVAKNRSGPVSSPTEFRRAFGVLFRRVELRRLAEARRYEASRT